MANHLFQTVSRLSYKELYEGIQKELSLSIRSAKEYIRFMRDCGIVERDSTTNQAYYTLIKKEEV